MCIANYIEFLTRFALVHAALTGASFCSSGRNFLDSCNRHGFLKVVIVDYLAAITLNFGSVVLGLLVGAITAGIVDSAVLSGKHSDDERERVLLVIGLCACLVASVVLVFISSLLLNVVDAAYSCVVLDLDNYTRTRTFHRPVVAQVVLYQTKPDLVVVAPNGGATYATAQPIVTTTGQPVVPTGQPVTYAMP